MKTLEQTLWSKSRYWWIVLLPGIILIPCGCWFLFSPTVGYFTITTTLLWILILIGITQLIIAFNTSRQSHRWGWWLAGGIIDVFIGIMMLNNISFSAMILPYFFAFTFLFKGVINVVSSFASMGYNTSWWLYLINGLLRHSNNFEQYLETIESQSIQTDFSFNRISDQSGLVNTNLYFVTFTPEYKTVKEKVK